MADNILEKTGKTQEQWIAIAKKSGLEKHGQIVKHLKEEHGLTHGYANTVALLARQAHAAAFSEDDLLEAQYKGKEHLKPIHDKLVEAIKKLGEDIEFVPKKANVSVRRKNQFALIQPSTKTRMDLGLKIKGKEPAGRLETSGPFGAMCSHRVQLTDVKDVNKEVIGYLKEAYEGAN